jgi:hypothetical protein
MLPKLPTMVIEKILNYLFDQWLRYRRFSKIKETIETFGSTPRFKYYFMQLCTKLFLAQDPEGSSVKDLVLYFTNLERITRGFPVYDIVHLDEHLNTFHCQWKRPTNFVYYDFDKFDDVIIDGFSARKIKRNSPRWRLLGMAEKPCTIIPLFISMYRDDGDCMLETDSCPCDVEFYQMFEIMARKSVQRIICDPSLFQLVFIKDCFPDMDFIDNDVFDCRSIEQIHSD